eukprot:15235125-Alexandrium_andersonii.AAC.1
MSAMPAVFASLQESGWGEVKMREVSEPVFCEVVPVPVRALPAVRLREDGEIRALVQEVGDAAD